MTEMRAYFVIGPPGAGKTSTLTKVCATNENISRFGVRDYGLALAAQGHPLGALLRPDLIEFRMLSDELAEREFSHFLSHVENPGQSKIVTVEGYPKAQKQCTAALGVLEQYIVEPAGVLELSAPRQALRERILTRRICVSCGLASATAQIANCPRCSSELVPRRDDTAEWFERRCDAYDRVRHIVLTELGEHMSVYHIDTIQTPADVAAAVQKVLQQPSAADAEV